MSQRAHRRKLHPRVWIIQLALVCFVALHSLGLLHHHATAAEHGACVACQVVDHQASSVPEAGSAPLVALLVWLLLGLPARPDAPRGFEFFSRPHSRAPPLRVYP